MRTELFLVRHGESVSNVQGRLCATPPGPGLTETGRAQAEAACQRILRAAPRPDRIFSSPLLRALETAKPLCLATGLTPEVRGALAETGFGDWDGRFVADLRGLAHFDAWCTDPEAYPPPGGESISQVGRRVGDVLRSVAQASSGETIVAFSHMHALVTFVRGMQGHPHREVEWLPNATIVHAYWDGTRFHFIDLDLEPAHVGQTDIAAGE